MTIEHLVISGGGPTGILAYGIASHLAKKGFWKLADIKSIYGCSIGAYMGVVLSLNYEWDWLDDYIIKRPWEKLVATSTTHLIDIYEKKCLINEHFFIEAITPLLKAKELKETITLKELYDYNKIDIHLYTTNINSARMEKIDLSYKSHPDLSVIKALQMSMAFPIIFEPIFEGEGCFIDGGIINNYPLKDCIQQQECDTDTILSFKNIWNKHKLNVNEKSSIFYFLFALLRKLQLTVDTEPEQPDIKYNIHCILEDWANLDKWAETLKNEELRRSIIEKGHAQAESFLAKHTQEHNQEK